MFSKLLIPKETLVSAVKTLPYDKYHMAIIAADNKENREKETLSNEFKEDNAKFISESFSVLMSELNNIVSTGKPSKSIYFNTKTLVTDKNKKITFKNYLRNNLSRAYTKDRDASISDSGALEKTFSQYLPNIITGILLSSGSNILGIDRNGKTRSSNPIYQQLTNSFPTTKQTNANKILDYISALTKDEIKNFSLEHNPTDIQELNLFINEDIITPFIQGKIKYSSDQDIEEKDYANEAKDKIHFDENKEGKFDLNIEGLSEEDKETVKNLISEISTQINKIANFSANEVRNDSFGKSFKDCIVLLNALGNENISNINNLVNIYKRIKDLGISESTINSYISAIGSAIIRKASNLGIGYDANADTSKNSIEFGNATITTENISNERAIEAIKQIIMYIICRNNYIESTSKFISENRNSKDPEVVSKRHTYESIAQKIRETDPSIITCYKLLRSYDAFIEISNGLKNVFQTINDLRDNNKSQIKDNVTNYEVVSVRGFTKNENIDNFVNYVISDNILNKISAEITIKALKHARPKIEYNENEFDIINSKDYKYIEKNLLANEIPAGMARDIYINYSNNFNNWRLIGKLMDMFYGGTKRRKATNAGISLVKGITYFLCNGGGRTFSRGMELLKAYPQKFINNHIVTSEEAKDIFRLFRNDKLKKSYRRLISLLGVKSNVGYSASASIKSIYFSTHGLLAEEKPSNENTQNNQENKNTGNLKTILNEIAILAKFDQKEIHTKKAEKKPEETNKNNENTEKNEVHSSKAVISDTITDEISDKTEQTRYSRLDQDDKYKANKKLYEYLMDMYIILSVGKINQIIAKYSENIIKTGTARVIKSVVKRIPNFTKDLSTIIRSVAINHKENADWQEKLREDFKELYKYNETDSRRDVATCLVLLIDQLYSLGCSIDQSETDLMTTDFNALSRNMRAISANLEDINKRTAASTGG